MRGRVQLPSAPDLSPAALATARTGAEVEPLERIRRRQRCPRTTRRQCTRRAARRRLTSRRAAPPSRSRTRRDPVTCEHSAHRALATKPEANASRAAPASTPAEQQRGARSRHGATSPGSAAVAASEHQGHTLHVAPDRDLYTAIKRAPLDSEGRFDLHRAACTGRRGSVEGRAGARRVALARGAAAGPWTGSATATRLANTFLARPAKIAPRSSAEHCQ
jgi:hypothetical protein